MLGKKALLGRGAFACDVARRPCAWLLGVSLRQQRRPWHPAARAGSGAVAARRGGLPGPPGPCRVARCSAGAPPIPRQRGGGVGEGGASARG